MIGTGVGIGKIEAANRADVPVADNGFVVARHDVGMAEARQMLGFGAKLREGDGAFIGVQNVEFLDRDGNIEFEVAATVDGAKGARTHGFADLVTLVQLARQCDVLARP